MKKLSFIQNTVVLVVSNLITGSLTFMFSIILSKEIGAQGVGLYYMVMPIYTLFICFTCGGVTTAISKLTAERSSEKNMRELYKGITASIAFFSFWTIFMSIMVIILAPYISTSVLKDTRSYLPILIFIPALLFVAIGSILKGYFYGLQNSTFPAIIDIVEKGVRIIILITVVTALKPMGLNYQVAGAVAAMSVGELTSTALLYLSYKKSRLGSKSITGHPDNVFQIIANILKVSLPLCINGLLATVLGTFIAAMIPRRLQAAGFAPETSLALFGKVSGMSLTIVMFPAIIIGAISIILVPAISEASAGKSMSIINRKIYSTLKLTTAIAAVSAGLFFSIPNELGRLFYSRNDLGNIIYSLSFGVIFIYIESTLFGILNGLGKQKVLLKNTIIMSLIDIILLYTLLGIPDINIYGYAVDFVVSPLVGCILNYLEIRKVTDLDISITEVLAFPLLVTAIEIICLNKLKPIAQAIFKTQSLISVSLIFTGIIIYGVLYYILNPYFKKQKKYRL